MKRESPEEPENLSLSQSIESAITPSDFEERNATIDLNTGGLMWVKDPEGKHRPAEAGSK